MKAEFVGGPHDGLVLNLPILAAQVNLRRPTKTEWEESGHDPLKINQPYATYELHECPGNETHPAHRGYVYRGEEVRK